MEEAFVTSVSKIIERDLTKLEEEISLYPSEDSVWKVFGGIKNSGGNLCLHLCGNLQHFIGAILGNVDYVRNRDYEFAAKGISKSNLIAEIQKTKQAVTASLAGLDISVLESEYPVKVFNYDMSTLHFLIHLTAHLEYHLGQINYHRRLV